ncbi:hypothetical protein APZ00_02785 [Pannonibacter phragmitetus]|uniref:Uncharacterized protein n=1 Tax=Pannonibacter phragmitetus TaxID=121719 RepID=A0A0U3E3G7_9HYPH|nr:hypothetical protein APZ00_02785 [Pannonibacter phragmitetus]
MPLGVLHLFRSASFDYLVEFAAIQPHAATFRAVVDFDTLTLAHNEVDPAMWAKSPGGFGARS